MKPFERIYRILAKKIGRIIPKTAAKWVINPIFIIGCARSGTTLLANLLGRHKDIAHFSEANDVWDPFGYPWAESNLKRPPNWLDPYTFNAMWWQDAAKKHTSVIRGTFGAYQRLRRKRYFLNKSPMNTFKIPYILEIFPQARFIHIYRDGRAVIFSYMKKEYEKMRGAAETYKKKGHFYQQEELLEIMAHSWVAHIDEVEKQKKESALEENELIHELSYEELCANPQEEMHKIYAFLGLAGDRSNIVSLPVIQNRNYKYRIDLSPAQIEKVGLIMKDALVSKGYMP